jgi:hypothetical protein
MLLQIRHRRIADRGGSLALIGAIEVLGSSTLVMFNSVTTYSPEINPIAISSFIYC